MVVGRGVEHAVQVVGRHLAQHAPDQEALHVGQRVGDISGVAIPRSSMIEQVHDQRVGGVAPHSRSRARAEASRGSGSAAGCRIRSRWRDRRASSAISASIGLLGFGELFEPFLLGPVDLGLLDPVVSADDQVEPDEQLEVRAEPVLHGEPHVPVDVLAPGGQPHEQVVAEQVGLAQLEPGVVEGLEDPVHVVAALCGDLDDRQARPDRLLDAGDVLVVVGSSTLVSTVRKNW